MQLIVPYVGEVEGVDRRLMGLAEFLGIRCTTLALDCHTRDYAEYLEKAVADRHTGFVINPGVLQRWVGGTVPAALVSCLARRFSHLLVHAPRPNDFDSNVIAALSEDRLQSVRAIGGAGSLYKVENGTQDICEAFSGLSFGPTNPDNDRTFVTGSQDADLRKLISIEEHPFLAVVSRGETEILFLGSEEVADLNSEVGDAFLAERFSQLVPQAMALRHIFNQECWHPCSQLACVVIDDPPLQKNYGFLNFESLLRLTQQNNFHATIAFIPHNFRRTSPQITQMFRENSCRLSICIHGNDHTGAEFASTDRALLNTLLDVAQHRMDLHHTMTGLIWDRVMVFPQGEFSLEAMEALRSYNFEAAVNTVPHPAQQPVSLTIGELAQPAVLRYGGFPLFIRKPIRRIQNHDIAFNLFFGKPVLIVEHHEVFQHPESLAEIATRINSVAPDIHWSNLANVVRNSILSRKAPDGTYHVRAYSGTVWIRNDSSSTKLFSIEWANCGKQFPPVEQVLKDNAACTGFEVDADGIRLAVELAPGSSKFAVTYRSTHTTVRSLGFRWNTKAFVRRRLSELRDNHLSKNQHLLKFAQTLQRRLLN